MARVCSNHSRVVAVLGPTNTGKTHFAVERMLAHRSGMMGFPLRLLAREIYDRIVSLKGAGSVALMTGEEKIGSDTAPYVVATVEAMPMSRDTAFLAVDEIQLCADPERGHVFTDRLLNARGYQETMFLGAETIRPILKRLVPEAEIVTRPRFSILACSGHQKLNRLPRRSAIVAFTTSDVYTLAEVIRRQRGGAAVVLGALSPRTRNAQVAMYQAGEVDHLVATDAIGMGLNMDLGHVAFASVRKFDGREDRRLTAPEVAQIAGRAGRHMANGTFGTTNGCEPLDDRLVEAVESHSFPPLKALRWRSSNLEFRSLDALQRSLEAPPPTTGLIRTRDALDDRSLAMLARRDAVRARADSQDRVRLLWQVCQIPDFRKTLTDAHLHLLATVYHHVTSGRGQLPNDWVGRMIARLDRVDGDIDTLVTRIAHVRTWTYLSHRDDWLDDPRHWQERGREVEDRLSDALHERLAQRFVDRRTSSLMRSLRGEGVVETAVEDDGEVVVDGHGVGRLDGLRFTPAAAAADVERRVLAAAARRAVIPELQRRATEMLRAGGDAFQLDETDSIVWQGSVIARLEAGDDLLRPRLRLLADEELGMQSKTALEQYLHRWLAAWIERRLGPLQAIRKAASGSELGGPGRGIAFMLVEALGSARRDAAESLIVRLEEGDRRGLARLGVRLGRNYLYVPKLLKPAAVEARARLWRIAHGRGLPLPEPGRTVLRAPDSGMDAEATLASGFAPFAAFALRQDVTERLAAAIRARARAAARFELPVELGAQAGLTRDELQAALADLGYRAREDKETGRSDWALEPRRRGNTAQPHPSRHPQPSSSPFAALAALKLAT